jgi:hypothetical protein
LKSNLKIEAWKEGDRERGGKGIGKREGDEHNTRKEVKAVAGPPNP